MSARDWQPAGQGWEAKEDRLQLEGWSRTRRVVVLRRRLKEPLGRAERRARRPIVADFIELGLGIDYINELRSQA